MKKDTLHTVVLFSVASAIFTIGECRLLISISSGSVSPNNSSDSPVAKPLTEPTPLSGSLLLPAVSPLVRSQQKGYVGAAQGSQVGETLLSPAERLYDKGLKA